MKAYFAASVYGKNKYKRYYEKIIECLQGENCEVIQEVMDKSVKEVRNISKGELSIVYKKMLKNIQESDIFIAEMTYGSPGLAMEIQDAIYRYKKPSLVLYNETKEGRMSAPFFGNPSKLLFVEEYNLTNIKGIVKSFLKKAVKKIPSERFTVRMSEELNEYIEYLKMLWKQSSKNDVVTMLIKEEMQKNEKYKKFRKRRSLRI